MWQIKSDVTILARADNLEQFEAQYLDFLDDWWNMASGPATLMDLNAEPRAVQVLELLFDRLFQSREIEDDQRELLVNMWLYLNMI
ncbi:hypothetical protein ABID56_001143 [Alkalibacillus flavidus]|uniref:YhdB-like protein n=1 Tax=Alkalibacillus flavidus TaxID=546021 RepID=A0ABV2KTZ1_9BACI